MTDARTYREKARQCRRLDRQSPAQRRYIRALADGFDRMADARSATANAMSAGERLSRTRSWLHTRLVRNLGDVVWRALAGAAVVLMISMAVSE